MKIKDIKKFIEVAHNKEIPKDVEEFFKQNRKGVTIEDMDFIHFVRAMIKEARNQPLVEGVY